MGWDEDREREKGMTMKEERGREGMDVWRKWGRGGEGMRDRRCGGMSVVGFIWECGRGRWERIMVWVVMLSEEGT